MSKWIQSKYTDKAIVCSICHNWISQGEPRMYDMISKSSAHQACTGAAQMNDHYTPPQPVVAQESPERESREEAIERMHAENVEWYKAQYDAMKEIAEVLRIMSTKMGGGE